jgi:hypothetical protein
MYSMRLRAPALLLIAVTLIMTPACTTTVTETKEYTPGGQLQTERYEEDDSTLYELRRVFESTIIEGEGVFESDNEGLARKAAISLAVDDLAAKVQTEVRSNTVIYQNDDVRSTVETKVHALVSNYSIDSQGYDPGTDKYRVRISVRGEHLIREIKRYIQ